MGRQINFYMSESVEREFFELLLSKGYKMFYRDFIEEKIQGLTSYDELNRRKWLIILYKDSYGPLKYSDEKRTEIDKSYSPVIEWCRTTIDGNEKIVHRGRIWMSGWIEFDDSVMEIQFKKDFNSLVNWIRRKVPKNEYTCKGHILSRYMNEELKIYEDQGYKITI